MKFRGEIVAGLILLLGGTAQAAEFAFGGTVIYRCTNPASKASWDIAIDLEHQRADSYPAQIGNSRVTWHNTEDSGNYALDRATGRLTVIRPSSTGGYAVFSDCAAGR